MTKPKRILIADDEEVIRMIIRMALGPGYEIVEAADGEEAWQKFEAAEFDVVIADLKMPRLTGQELLKRIERKNANTPVILLTGNLEAPAPSRGKVRVVTKPFDNAELAATVKELISL